MANHVVTVVFCVKSYCYYIVRIEDNILEVFEMDDQLDNFGIIVIYIDSEYLPAGLRCGYILRIKIILDFTDVLIVLIILNCDGRANMSFIDMSILDMFDYYEGGDYFDIDVTIILAGTISIRRDGAMIGGIHLFLITRLPPSGLVSARMNVSSQ